MVLAMTERMRDPGTPSQPAIEASMPKPAWLPIIGTPSTTMPGIPPDCSVFIICTQLPWASTQVSSQLPEGSFLIGLGPADAQPKAANCDGAVVNWTCRVRSTPAFARERLSSVANCA